MINLTGRRTLITGGSRGIGRAAALLFAEAGSDVAITYQCREEAALEVRSAVEKIGRNCFTYKVELSSEDQVRSLAAALAERWGGLDALVNNAGIWTPLEMGAGDAEAWRETMAVNLDGLFYLVDAVLPLLKARPRSAIVNVGSTAGIRGEAFHSHYAASKGAMNALTKSWAVEFAPWNINVNCVAPGWVDTDMCTGVFGDAAYRESVRQSIPLKRIPPPEDIAGPILFLASDLARHITGAVLSVNGGGVLCGA
ncbi:MAG: SDR family NAD(P)-dependent oxidoreductase [Candidatus Aminicenantes bacterium]|nr:SDR family NAD(P)-dependent oxidoreductase [Candidatus Aminicenantes bacterium]